MFPVLMVDVTNFSGRLPSSSPAAWFAVSIFYDDTKPELDGLFRCFNSLASFHLFRSWLLRVGRADDSSRSPSSGPAREVCVPFAEERSGVDRSGGVQGLFASPRVLRGVTFGSRCRGHPVI